MTTNELEDLINRDTIIMLVTSPYWIAKFAWLVAAGWWDGRMANR